MAIGFETAAETAAFTAAFSTGFLTTKLKADLVKKKFCIVRESNPGRPRGRRAFYH